MSTATEITRLQNARNTIRDKLIDLGLANSTAKIDVLATAVNGIVNNGAISADVKEGEAYTIPAGYHNGSGTVTGVSGGGNYTLQAKEVTPTKSQQSVTPDAGKYGLSSVTVKAIPDSYQNVSGVTATAADVVANKIIVTATGESVAGTMPDNGTVEKVLDATSGNQSYTIPAGKHSGSGIVSIVLEGKNVTPSSEDQTINPTAGKVLSTVIVKATPTEEKSATPTTSEQSITPSNGMFLSKVTVEAIPAKYGDTTNADVKEGDIVAGKIAIGKNSGTNAAVEITGTMVDRGSVAATIDGLTTTSYTIPAGKHSGSGTVSLTNDIETALAAI